jgi:hypothetical protein
MPNDALREDQIRSIEREIEAAFVKTLRLSGIWKSTLRN